MKRFGRLRRRSSRLNHEGSWAISYGDMITLLLGFFIMYFSIEPPKKEQSTLTNSLMSALKEVDKNMKTEIKIQDTANFDVKNDPSIEVIESQLVLKESQVQQASIEPMKTKEKNETSIPSNSGENSIKSPWQAVIELVLPRQTNKVELSAKNPGQEELVAQAPNMQTQTEAASKEGAPSGSASLVPKASGYRPEIAEIKALDAEARRIGDRVYIMFPHISFFDTASTDITPEGQKAIEKFGKAYMPFAGKALLNIVGFSDERPVQNKHHRFSDNLELSVLRAVSAQRIAEKIGIPLNRTRLMGHGVSKELLEGESADDKNQRWALTRKIMLVIEPELN